jgi:hypothetical protein
MQRKSSAHHKAVTDAQRGAAAQSAVRTGREPKPAQPASGREEKPASAREERPASAREGKLALPTASFGNGETTLGGHVDRGLTLSALYDIGVLERLRLEVRVRILSDLAQSLAWLHANPRLMAAHPHLVIAPSTIVIGLDGVARVDVRAAKKRESERNPSEIDYVAPELLGGETADLRADIYSLGVLAWEALAGKRISAPDAWPSDVPRLPEEGGSNSDLPAALGGGKERDPLRRKPPTRPAPKTSHSRLRIPPPLALPEDGEWAKALAELALQAMCAEPGERPQDCRPIILALEQLAAHLAATHEIAEVVQGISGVDTLCIPAPTLPDADTTCQSEEGGSLGFMDRNACQVDMPRCAQRQVAVTRHVIAPAPPPPPAVVAPPIAAAPPTARSRTVKQLHAIGAGSSSTVGFVVAGLLALALLGLLAGYVASILAVR